MSAPAVVNTPSASYQAHSSIATSTTFTSTHTSSSGSDRCLVAVVAVRRNGAGTAPDLTLTWNGTSMTRAIQEKWLDASSTREIVLAIFTLNDPASATAGAWLLTASGSNLIGEAQIWAYNVEGCPAGVADAVASMDLSSPTTGTAVSVTIAPSVANTLCIAAISHQDTTRTISWTLPLSEDDEKRGSSNMNTSPAHGTLTASGSQSIGGTISSADQWGIVAITLIGTTSAEPQGGEIVVTGEGPAITFRPGAQPEGGTIAIDAEGPAVTGAGATPQLELEGGEIAVSNNTGPLLTGSGVIYHETAGGIRPAIRPAIRAAIRPAIRPEA